MKEKANYDKSATRQKPGVTVYDKLHQLCKEDYGITGFVLAALTDAIRYVEGEEYKPDKSGDWRPAAERIKKHLDL